MPRRRITRYLLALTAGIGFVAVPTPAYAHGIGGEASDASILGFVPIGIEHMLLGWDHLLFVAGVLLVAAQARLAAKLISIFALGHSTTLILATLAGWQINAEAVDVVIALSVVFVAAVAMLGRPKDFRWFGAVVLGFGLIHGLGLATRFHDLGIPEDGQLWRVIAFNIGIEIGQLTAIMAIVTLTLLASTFVVRDREKTATTLAAASLFVGGSVAASMVAYQAFRGPEPGGEVEIAYAGTTGSCTVADRTEPLPAMGDHTSKDFFEPDEEAALGDFGHSVGDGYIVVLYPVSLTDPELAELRSFVSGDDGQGVLGGAAEQVEDKIIAITSGPQLTCTDVDVDALVEFKTDWFSTE